MSNLVVPSHTAVDSIPIGRRIAEIMSEKGAAYTISAMAKRLDINRETLRQMLKGEREIYTFELDKIAQDLKVSVERILQTDIANEWEPLKKAVSAAQIEDTDALVTSIAERAIGLTEKCQILNLQAKRFFALQNFNNAHELWGQALSFAQMAFDKYGDSDWLLRIVSNMTLTYRNRKEFTKMYEAVALVEPLMEKHLNYSYVIYSSLAIAKIDESNFEEAKTYLQKSHQFARKINEPRKIIKSITNVAYIEYLMKNYDKAKELYESHLEQFRDTQDPYYISLHYQEYAKTLFRLKEIDKAEQILQLALTYFNEIHTLLDINAEVQLYFLLAITNNDPYYAEKLIHREDISKDIRKIAGKFLIDYYDRMGDLDQKEKYQKVNQLQYTTIDLLLDAKDHDSDYLLSLFEVCHLVGLK